MVLLMIFTSLLGLEGTFRVVSIERSLALESDGQFLTFPGKIVHEGSRLYLVDNTSLDIWAFDYYKGKHVYFGGKGDGPGELRTKIVSFYLSSGMLNVFHGNGSRLETYSLLGNLENSVQTAHSPTFFIRSDTTVYQDGSSIVLKQGEAIKATIPSFDPKIYGFTIHGSVLDQFLMLASEISNNNTIKFVIFDTHTGHLVMSDIVDKISKTTQKDLPAKMKKEMKGLDMSRMYFNNFQSIPTQEHLGFLLLESSFSKSNSDEAGNSSFLHIISPQKKHRSTGRLFHNQFKKLGFVIPRADDTWIAFDGSESQIVFLKVEKE